MKNRNTLITWGIIFAILVGSGLLTILLPGMLDGRGSTIPLPSETSTVTVSLPIPIGGSSEITLASWQWMLGLAIIVPGLVIGAGLTLALIYILISRMVVRTAASAEYQQSAATLQKRYNDQVASMRQTRPTSVAPETTWRRWGVITTGIIIVMFVAFITLLFANLIFPSGQIVRGETIVNVTSALTLTMMVVALAAIGMWLRSERIAAYNRTESMAIPWDFIAIVMTFLLVVGLGIAIIAILNFSS